MKTNVRFYEGLKGSGVVVGVNYGNDRVIFDFGAPFRPNSNVYDGTVIRRKAGALRDALIFKETPEIDGVYRKEDLMFNGKLYHDIVPAEESEMNTIVVISHLHLDHMSNIKYLDESIPVYMHKNAYKVHQAVVEFDEEPVHDNIVGVDLYDEIKVGAITCTPYFSDHPCYGSVGYLIKTPDQTIYYSGDIRFHGLQRERAFEELEKLNKLDIDLLIIDGTSYSPSKFKHDESAFDELSKPNKDILAGMFLEASIYDDVANKLKETGNLGVFNIYHRDMQLIEALIKSCNAVNREVVFEVETAYVINEVLDMSVSYYVSDTTVREDIYQKVAARNNVVTVSEINQNKDKYIVQVSYKNILSLHDFDTENGVFFHLFGEPFGSGNKAFTIFERMLQNAGLTYFGYSNLYSFNHAFPNHLSYMIEKVNAKSVVAVHSNVPEKLTPMNSKHYLPKQNVVYELVNGELIEK